MPSPHRCSPPINAQVVVDAIGLGATYALMAVGIGLVFGVLRLVNFAYGQLIMFGAYTLAYTSSWPLLWSIVACFAVVIALSLAMERTVFRPLREQSPTVMLVATFAISFVLQSVALLIDIRDDQIGEPVASLTSLNKAITIGGVDIRKVTIVAVIVAIGALGALALLLGRTDIGLRTRAAAADFRTARMLGVKANQVIGLAVVVSGALAATVAVILTVQTPVRDARLRAAGHDHRARRGRRRGHRPPLDGHARRLPDRLHLGHRQRRAADRQHRLPAVRRVRARDPRPAAAPGRVVRARALLGGRPRMSRSRTALIELLGPVVLVVIVGLVSTQLSLSNELYFLNAIVAVSMVVAVYVFVGNSGVLSFGQISFVAVGGFASGLMTIPVESKTGVLPDLFPILRDHTLGNIPSLALAALVGGVMALILGHAADAALGPGCRHRDARRARDHAQRAARVDEDRPRRDDALRSSPSRRAPRSR